MMKYRKTGKFKLGFLTLLLSVLFVACGSGASDADRQIKSKTDLKGAVIGVQLGTTSDGLATELEKEGGGTKVERYNKGADAIQAEVAIASVEAVFDWRAYLKENFGWQEKV